MSETMAQSDRAHPEGQSRSDAAAGRKRGLARRLGCGLVLPLWFALLMTPCALFYLAANGEIRLEHGDIPQPHAHPLLLVSLVSEAEDRGLRIETAWIAERQSSGETLCVETAARFLLWEYSGGNQNASWCDCYTRKDAEANWELVKTYGGAC